MDEPENPWAAPDACLSGRTTPLHRGSRRLKIRYYGLLGIVALASVLLALPLCYMLVFGLADIFGLPMAGEPVREHPNAIPWLVSVLGMLAVTLLAAPFLPISILAFLLYLRGSLKANAVMGFVCRGQYPSDWYRDPPCEPDRDPS